MCSLKYMYVKKNIYIYINLSNKFDNMGWKNR